MEKVLKKGFTLIELMVVIAIIGILATTLAPKLREQLAKAKDSKAVSFLGASRTVASSLIISHMTSDSDGSETVGIETDKLLGQMDVTTKGLIQKSGATGEGQLIIGGSRASDNTLTYGGTVALISATQGTVASKSTPSLNLLNSTKGFNIKDASDLHLYSYDTTVKSLVLKISSKKSTEGKSWFAY